jgi:hypothetical protein
LIKKEPIIIYNFLSNYYIYLFQTRTNTFNSSYFRLFNNKDEINKILLYLLEDIKLLNFEEKFKKCRKEKFTEQLKYIFPIKVMSNQKEHFSINKNVIILLKS